MNAMSPRLNLGFGAARAGGNSFGATSRRCAGGSPRDATEHCRSRAPRAGRPSAAALAPARGPAPKGGLRAKSGGPRPAGLALEQEPPKEMTKDMFGTNYESQNDLCYQYLIPIGAGIIAGILKVVTKADGCLYMLLDAVSFTGSIVAIFTLFFVFGSAHNGTRLWDQYDNAESYGGLSPSCFWCVVLAVWQVVQCACLCCCLGVVGVGAGAAAAMDK